MAPKKRSSASSPRSSKNVRTSWDPLAEWYDGWVGKGGSKHHRRLAIPALLDLLDPQPEERILDMGAGQGVLAPFIADARATYTGIDVSPKLLHMARKHHGQQGRFLQIDARTLADSDQFEAASFDAVTFLLSIQDMDPLESVLRSAAWALRPGGRSVILMTHPCFRIPRQSGWGWDEARKLRYRRIDRYLTPLPVPLKGYQEGGRRGVTRSYHRPLQAYVNGLAAQGLWLNCMREIPTNIESSSKKPQAKAINRANEEIPLFLALRAVKVE